MGSTLVAMLWSETSAVLANVGDSRVYLLRNLGPDSNRILQITEDHTYGHLVSDAADVPNLPERLSRFLDGRVDGRSPDLTNWGLCPGDRFLLCPDGLSSFVPHHLIHDALRSSSGPGAVADRLITLALDHGGQDNVTVVTVDVRTSGQE
jgi:serine/threonine protein phosphatase PrpC